MRARSATLQHISRFSVSRPSPLLTRRAVLSFTGHSNASTLGHIVHTFAGAALSTAAAPAPAISRLAPLQEPQPRMTTDANVKRIIDFWFNRPPIEWIVAPEGLDAELKAEFGNIVVQARQGELDSWLNQAESSVALVVMLDQFSRNLYRGSPEAFSADSKSFEAATNAITQGFDKQVTVIQATALYMPLMQQESLISLIAASCLFEATKSRCVSDEEHRWVDMGISAAKRHMQQLSKFGRYPTRNALLGRTSTAAEEKFLREHVATL